MPNTAAGMANKISQKEFKTRSLESAALDRRYGKIGISAVAAAARYQGGAKNPAYAPAPVRLQVRTDDAAA